MIMTQAYTQYIERLGANFGKVADHYHQNARLQKQVALDLARQFELMQLRPNTFLDLGCGSGFVMDALADYFPGASYCGVDLSLEMLGLCNNDVFLMSRVVADAHCLPFSHHSFECVVSNLMLQWSTDIKSLLAETHRVLVEGGMFLATTLGAGSFPELRAACEQVGQSMPTNPMVDLHDLGDLMYHSGFSESVTSSIEYTLMFDSPEAVLAHFKKLGAHTKMPNRASESTLSYQAYKRLLEVYVQYESEGGKFPLTYQVIFCHGLAKKKSGSEQKGSVSISDIVGLGGG
jgi:malonyl-CoA O-methyltransferase